MSIPEVFDEDGTLYDFINDPKGYDVSHLGASEGAIKAWELTNNNETANPANAAKISAEPEAANANAANANNNGNYLIANAASC
jgi:hypothetical protein